MNSWLPKAMILLGLFAAGFMLTACDPYHKNKCEWYLVPEPDHADSVESGWVALCARNYVINKQRCQLRAKLGFAKKVFNKPFRYTSLKVKPGKYPKEVESVTLCQPEG